MSILNTNTRYLHDYIVKYSQELLNTFPDTLNVCYLVCKCCVFKVLFNDIALKVCSGSEANELALRLARCYTKKQNILVMEHGYHGNTGSLVSLSPYKCEGKGGEGLSKNARKAPLPDLYRNKFSTNDDEKISKKYATLALHEIHQLSDHTDGFAGFIAESILGCAGQIVYPKGYLKNLYKFVRDYGGVCIADEVQVGFGRCGSSWWAFESQDVIPDIVTLGKRKIIFFNYLFVY